MTEQQSTATPSAVPLPGQKTTPSDEKRSESTSRAASISSVGSTGANVPSQSGGKVATQQMLQQQMAQQNSNMQTQLAQLRQLQQTNPTAYAKYMQQSTLYANYYKTMLMARKQQITQAYGGYGAGTYGGGTVGTAINYMRAQPYSYTAATYSQSSYTAAQAESPTHGLPQMFKDKAKEYEEKMNAEFKKIKFKGHEEFWGKEKEEQMKIFDEWRDNLSSDSIKTIEDFPEEITKCLGLWLHERLDPLSKLVKQIREEFKMEPILNEDQFRQFILKVSARRPYGVKPYYQVNEYEQEGKDNLKYLWETTPNFMPDKYSYTAKEDRGVRKKQQVCVWNYWLYHKRMRTTRRGEERTRMLQTQIDKIQTWENRRKDQERRTKEKQQLWEQQAEERVKLDKEREKTRKTAMAEKLQTMAERQMERAKKEAERKQLKNQRVSSAMARAIENKTVKLNKSTVYGLEHFVDPSVNSNISRRSGMASRKFLPFQPEWGAEYNNTKPATLPKYFDLFFPLTYDQCTEQLLLYRTSKTHKKQSERCNGVRRENVWCYRHFHTDYRPPWSGIETRTSKKVFGRRPFAKDEDQQTNYDGEDSGVEWYGDVETEEKGDIGRETSLAMETDGEGEDLGESDEEEFSDDDPHEGLRADGYEDDGFLDDDGDMFQPKIRKKEDRYPIRPDRTRGDKDPKPITLLLPPCLPANHLDKKAKLHPFHKFLMTRGELIELAKDQIVICHEDKLVLPQNLVNWRNTLIKKRKAAWIAKKKKRKRASSPTIGKGTKKKR